MRCFLILASLLLLQISHSTAQTTLPSKIYVGIHGFAGNYNIFYPREFSSRYIASKPLQLDAGFQFTPQWSVQTGWINSKQISQNKGEYINSAGKITNYYNYDKQTSMVFPVLLRYTVTRKFSHKVKFDILGGITIVRAKYHNKANRFDDGQLSYNLDQSNQATNLLLTAGPSLRYTIGNRFELITTGTVNKSLNNRDNKSGLSPTVSAGIHYRFFYKKN